MYDIESIGKEEKSDNDLLLEDFNKDIEETLKNEKHRLMFRNKYSLPPLDPRYLEMTDEDIIKDLVLMNKLENPENDQDKDDGVSIHSKNGETMETYKTQKKSWDDIVKSIDEGVDVFAQLSDTLKNIEGGWEEVK